MSGDGYPAQTVDFGRDAELTKALSGSATWDSSGINPVDDLEDWAITLQDKSGVVAKTVVMDPQAWKIFRSNTTVQKYCDIRRGTNNTINIDPQIISENEKARYAGSIGDFAIWVYNDTYVDDKGVTCKLLPEKTVILGSREGLEGTRCYRSTMKKPTGRRNATLQSLGLKKIRVCVGCCCNPRHWSFLIVQTLPCV